MFAASSDPKSVDEMQELLEESIKGTLHLIHVWHSLVEHGPKSQPPHTRVAYTCQPMHAYSTAGIYVFRTIVSLVQYMFIVFVYVMITPC